jgi:hypothetical protein
MKQWISDDIFLCDGLTVKITGFHVSWPKVYLEINGKIAFWEQVGDKVPEFVLEEGDIVPEMTRCDIDAVFTMEQTILPNGNVIDVWEFNSNGQLIFALELGECTCDSFETFFDGCQCGRKVAMSTSL